MGKCVMYIMGMDSTKYGGIERFNVALASALQRRGYNSVFVYESYPECSQFVSDLTDAGGTLLVCNSRRNKLRFCFRISRIIHRYRPTILHAHFTKARFFALPIAYLLGIRKLFFTVHGEVGDLSSIKPHTRWWYNWASHKAKVITVSDQIRAQFLNNWPIATVERIYLGVSAITGTFSNSRKLLGIPDEQTVILTIANFNHIKGLDVLCHAIALLSEQTALNSNTHFYIVGQPQKEIQQLSELAKQLGISSYIHMEGISNQIATYLTASNLYVQPSRSEGLPLSLMEAASVGLPLIGTKVGGNPEIIEHEYNGLLVDSENSQQLAEAILSILSQPSLQKQYGAGSMQKYKQLFAIGTAVDNMITYYHLP